MRCLLIDFSKAFDTINHAILFKKLFDLNFSPNITLWIYNFLCGHTQAVLLGGIISDWKSITASIVQDSGIGPILFIIYSMDLKPLSDYNKILKYADDTSLLVPQHSSVSLEAEFTHISSWSDSNKLKINTAKTKEIIFNRPRRPRKYFPSP